MMHLILVFGILVWAGMWVGECRKSWRKRKATRTYTQPRYELLTEDSTKEAVLACCASLPASYRKKGFPGDVVDVHMGVVSGGNMFEKGTVDSISYKANTRRVRCNGTIYTQKWVHDYSWIDVGAESLGGCYEHS